MLSNFIFFFFFFGGSPKIHLGGLSCLSSAVRSRAGDLEQQLLLLLQVWQRVLLAAFPTLPAQGKLLPAAHPAASCPSTCGKEADGLLLNEASVTGGAQGKPRQNQ